jgi:hypothetical protein
MKITIELTGGSITLEVADGAGSVTSTFHDEVRDALELERDEEQALAWIKYDAALDGIESLILAHACAGIDVKDPKYVEGLETAIHAAENQI